MTGVAAQVYGLKPTKPKQHSPSGKQQLEALLKDSCREQKLAALETTYGLPTLTPTPQTPHPREARYIALTTQVTSILPEAARNTPSSLWYVLAGIR